MNIYVLDTNPVLAARYHCDHHVKKMLFETVQILSAVHHRHPHKNNYKHVKTKIYKPVHLNNRFVIWASYDICHYLWLLSLAQELRNEHLRRFKTTTKAMGILLYLSKYLPKLAINRLATPDWFELATGIPNNCVINLKANYVVSANGNLVKKNLDTMNYFIDVVETYRNFYHSNKRHIALWDNGLRKPEWFQIKENF